MQIRSTSSRSMGCSPSIPPSSVHSEISPLSGSINQRCSKYPWSPSAVASSSRSTALKSTIFAPGHTIDATDGNPGRSMNTDDEAAARRHRPLPHTHVRIRQGHDGDTPAGRAGPPDPRWSTLTLCHVCPGGLARVRSEYWPVGRQDGCMLVVRATKKLLDRLAPVALFVSEATLFPILMPLAPAATLLARFPDGLAQALSAHDVPEAFITQELSRMQEVRLGKTASRSVLGIMNEFTFLAQTMRGDTTTDLTDLARWLARTPCSPLFKRHGSPDRELRALVEAADQETPTR